MKIDECFLILNFVSFVTFVVKLCNEKIPTLKFYNFEACLRILI